MALLTSHTQVHPGLLISLVELLLVAEKPLEDKKVERLLAPNSLDLFGIGAPKGIVELTLTAAEWLKLVKRSGGEVDLTPNLKNLLVEELFERLPIVIDEGLFKREWRNITTPEGLKVNRDSGGDIGIVLAWFMAQDPYDLKKLDPGALEASWKRQLLEEKIPNPNEFELFNKTKSTAMRKWIKYLGYGVEVDNGIFVPDPAKAIQRKLDDLKQKQIEYSASTFVSEVSKFLPVLDGGKIRKWVKAATESDGPIYWEHNSKRISPSLGLALRRLEKGKKIEFGPVPDAPEADRRFFDDDNWISQVRIL
tara:strand:- start:92 stop:1015 length:924 start_codon:yes stop_codon:yes gene_type:complete